MFQLYPPLEKMEPNSLCSFAPLFLKVDFKSNNDRKLY